MQAKAPETKPFGKEAFAPSDGTVIRWLGNAGALINSRGTTIMIDPVLSGFDMPLLIKVPITEEVVPHVDAVLLTHCDNDHYSRATCKKLAGKTKEFHGPHYVAGLLREEQGIDGIGHDIRETFQTGNVSVTRRRRITHGRTNPPNIIQGILKWRISVGSGWIRQMAVSGLWGTAG